MEIGPWAVRCFPVRGGPRPSQSLKGSDLGLLPGGTIKIVENGRETMAPDYSDDYDFYLGYPPIDPDVVSAENLKRALEGVETPLPGADYFFVTMDTPDQYWLLHDRVSRLTDAQVERAKEIHRKAHSE